MTYMTYIHAYIYTYVQEWPQGESFTFPDGVTLPSSSFLAPSLPGRRVVVMGDTCSGELIAPLAQDADVLIHEATNAWAPNMVPHKSYRYIDVDV